MEIPVEMQGNPVAMRIAIGLLMGMRMGMGIAYFMSVKIIIRTKYLVCH